VIKGDKALSPYIEEGFALIAIVFKTNLITKYTGTNSSIQIPQYALSKKICP
jgi:hypothetical protein